MNLLQRWRSRAFGGRWRKTELQEELESHLNMAIADRVARGESEGVARREALREFGNVPMIADVTREGWGWLWLERLQQDLKYALHQLRKSPGFAFTAILTLALGIGANIAVFSLIYAIMLRSLPVPHPEELVQLEMRSGGVPESYEMTSMYNVVAAHQQALTGMCGWMFDGLLLTGDGDPKRLHSGNVTGDCFSTLQLTPLLGRLLNPADDIEGGGPEGYAAVLSYDYWNAHFGRDPKVIGRKLIFQNVFSQTKAAVVVGVLPKSFHGLAVGMSPELYLPSYLEGKDNRDSNGNISMLVFGRLKPGVTPAQAELQLRPAFAAWRTGLAAANRGDLKKDLQENDLGVYPARIGSSEMAKMFGTALLFLQLLVGLILVAGCSYLSALLSARTMARRKELGLRFALGASRARIALQLMVESLLLAAIGCAAGLGLAWGTARLLVTYLASSRERIVVDVHPGSAVVAFSIGVAVFAALTMGLGPALRGSKANVIADLKEGASVPSGRRAWWRMGWRGSGRIGGVLLPLQIAFSVVVVVIASLLSASLVRVLKQENGFRLSGTLFVETDIPAVLIDDEKPDAKTKAIQEAKLKAAVAQYQEIGERLNQSPGIVSASMARVHPLEGSAYVGAYKTVGVKENREDRSIYENWIGPRSFETVGTRILRGREFSRADGPDGPKVCILSASAARHFFPDGNAIGQSLEPIWAKKRDEAIVVVGIVEDTRWLGLQQEMPEMIYFPAAQESGFLPSLEIVLRTDDSATALASLRRVLREVAGAHITETIDVRDAVDGSLGQQRLLATLSNMLAGLALLLSAVAIYGLLSYSVKQRDCGDRGADGARSCARGCYAHDCETSGVAGVAWAGCGRNRRCCFEPGVQEPAVSDQPDRSFGVFSESGRTARRCRRGGLIAGATRGFDRSNGSVARGVVLVKPCGFVWTGRRRR